MLYSGEGRPCQFVSEAEEDANTTPVLGDTRKDNMVTHDSAEGRLGRGRLHMCGSSVCFQAAGCGAFVSWIK